MGRAGIIYGLLVAVLWGTTDVLATIATRKIGSLLTTFFSVLASVVVLTLFGIFTGQAALILALPHTTLLMSIPIGLITGLCAAVGYFSLNRGLERGPLALVSPLVAADGAIAALLAVLFLGDVLPFWQSGLLVCIFVGILCASTDIHEIHLMLQFRRTETQSVGKGGIRWGLLATITFGFMLFSIGATSKVWGWFWPIFCTRLFAALFLACVVGYQKYHARSRHISKGPVRIPLTFQLISLVAIVGTTETAGLLTYSVGTALTETSVVAALSSCFGLIPLAAGIIVLHEQPTKLQILGILLVIGGLLLLAIKPS